MKVIDGGFKDKEENQPSTKESIAGILSNYDDDFQEDFILVFVNDKGDGRLFTTIGTSDLNMALDMLKLSILDGETGGVDN